MSKTDDYIKKYNDIPRGYKYLVIEQVWKRQESGEVAMTRFKSGLLRDPGLIAKIESAIDLAKEWIQFAKLTQCSLTDSVRASHPKINGEVFNNINYAQLVEYEIRSKLKGEEYRIENFTQVLKKSEEFIKNLKKDDLFKVRILIAKYLISPL